MIAVAGISKRFGTGSASVVAVDHLDLEVRDGSYCTILGPSGCGKTTTLRIVAGLERPDAGLVTIGGRTVHDVAAGTDIPAHRRGVGMVFQSYALWPHMTVRQHVAYPMRFGRAGRATVRARVGELLELVELAELAGRRPAQLSGGQRQRVALARALACEPHVLLLDEPLSSLDAALRSQVQAELKALQRRVGITTLHVTHDRREALSLADEVVVLDRGALAQRGTPEEVYERPRTRFAAELLGNTNVLGGTIRSRTGRGRAIVDTVIGALDALADETARVGDAVTLSIRPESITLAPQRESSSAVGVAKVVHRTYMGASAEVRVDVDGVALEVRDPTRRVLVGDAVTLEVARDGCVVLADQPDAAPSTNAASV